MQQTHNDLIFYHIYPLGFCGAPDKNDFISAPVNRIEIIHNWINHFKFLGINALYLGPFFESSAHGYDTADYYNVDRRLGTNETFKILSLALHNNGIKLILDGVFNHTGRSFWAFKDIQEKRKASPYCSWYRGLNFNSNNNYNDGFSYEGWNGYYNLVKLDLFNPDVKAHLFNAIKMWIEEFGIDGLRLDAADCLPFEFMQELSSFCKNIKRDFFITGEVIHGDYNKWANPAALDSVTNYECYKGLYSSLNDKNYFEIAYALNRQFGSTGIYKDLPLYNFADNHDVNRIASVLNNHCHLYPLYLLLFTMPGVPSVYYGSEWGIKGEKANNSDAPLRPAIGGDVFKEEPDLEKVITLLINIRNRTEALRYGGYKQLYINHEQFAFAREYNGKQVIVVLNSSDNNIPIKIDTTEKNGTIYKDILNGNRGYITGGGKLIIEPVYKYWGCILEKI